MLCLSGFELYSRWVPLVEVVFLWSVKFLEFVLAAWSIVFTIGNRPVSVVQSVTVRRLILQHG